MIQDKKTRITEDLIKKLEISTQSFDSCYTILDDIKYLGKVTESQREIIDSSQYLLRQIDYSWRILIIELWKLFKPNQHFSVQKILNILESNYKSISWHNQIPIEKINELQNRLDQPEYIEALKTLDSVRSKFVAHIDNNRFSFEKRITKDHVTILIEYGKEMFNIVWLSLDGSEFMFNHLRFNGINSIVNKILDIES